MLFYCFCLLNVTLKTNVMHASCVYEHFVTTDPQNGSGFINQWSRVPRVAGTDGVVPEAWLSCVYFHPQL